MAAQNMSKSKISNLSFENIDKRILPQLITKGHVLRREPLCTKGLFFICPSAVHDRIMTRVGKLDNYPIQSGSVAFSSPKYLPPQGVYEEAIRKALMKRFEQSP